MNKQIMKQATKLTVAYNSANTIRQLQKKIKEYEATLAGFTKPYERGKAKTIQDKLNLFKKKLLAKYDNLIQTYTKNRDQLARKHFKTNIVKVKQQKKDNKFNKCPSCGADIKDGQKFCTQCGEKLYWGQNSKMDTNINTNVGIDEVTESTISKFEKIYKKIVLETNNLK